MSESRNPWQQTNALPTSTRSISPAQLEANRANAQLSSGPITEAGKAKSSLNAVKTGLTGQTVLLPTDEVAEYERHMAAYFTELAPVGQLETDLVRSIAQTVWRLKRIPTLEAGICALGQWQLADEFADHDPELRPSLVQVAVHLKYEKQLRNLQLQESRLERRREKQLAELRSLQQQRLGPGKIETEDEDEENLDFMNTEHYRQFLHGGPMMDAIMKRAEQDGAGHAEQDGFEFSNAENGPADHTNSSRIPELCEAI